MNKSIVLSSHSDENIETYIKNNNQSEIFYAVFDDNFVDISKFIPESKAINVIDNFKFDGVEKFVSGFIYTSDLFVLFVKNNTYAGLSNSKSYDRFVHLLGMLKKNTLI